MSDATPDRADLLRESLMRHFGPTYEDAIEAVLHEVATPDRADPARMSDAAWTIQQLRENERTDPASPFWEGWDAALAAVEVALRATPDRADPLPPPNEALIGYRSEGAPRGYNLATPDRADLPLDRADPT